MCLVLRATSAATAAPEMCCVAPDHEDIAGCIMDMLVEYVMECGTDGNDNQDKDNGQEQG